MRRKISFFIIGVMSIALLAGCRQIPPDTLPADGPGGPAVDVPAPASDGAGTPPEQCGFAEFGAAGKILSIAESEDDNILGIIEVKADRDTGQIYDYAMVTITPDTRIDLNGPASFSDLEEEMQVTVFFDGGVDESYPVQGTARQVVVVVNPDITEE
mgnify:CR=1 FL=1